MQLISGASLPNSWCRDNGKYFDASIIQTRHRIPEVKLKSDQIIVYQVPIPEPLRWIEPREEETRKMHALTEYGVMHVGLYENIAHFGKVTTSYDYPVQVNDHYVMSPIPYLNLTTQKWIKCLPCSYLELGEKNVFMPFLPIPK